LRKAWDTPWVSNESKGEAAQRKKNTVTNQALLHQKAEAKLLLKKVESPWWVYRRLERITLMLV
jgi:hypothetical protein